MITYKDSERVEVQNTPIYTCLTYISMLLKKKDIGKTKLYRKITKRSSHSDEYTQRKIV